MQSYLIVADDLTGANATCSLLKKVGLRTASIFDFESEKLPEDIDVISFSTDSRGIIGEEAYQRVKNVTNKFKAENIHLYNKRIDSTMRGNIGYEIDAMLDVLDDRIAVVVPSYPSSKRVVLNKTMLVNGNLLLNSDAGKDTKTPVKSSSVEEIIKSQTRNDISYFSLNEVEGDEEKLLKDIQEKSKKFKILLFDATTDADIKKIAKIIVKSKIKVITVDPGPFTMFCAKEMERTKLRNDKILMIIGSATETSSKQIEYIIETEDIFLKKINPELFFKNKKQEIEINKIVDEIIKEYEKHNLFLLTTTPINGDKKLNLKSIGERLKISIDEVSKIISDTLTEVSVRVLKDKNFNGIYSSGGDITLSLLNKVNATGVEILEEVMPLVAYGKIIGGSLEGLNLVTKGGMVGKNDAIKKCLNKLQENF